MVGVGAASAEEGLGREVCTVRFVGVLVLFKSLFLLASGIAGLLFFCCCELISPIDCLAVLHHINFNVTLRSLSKFRKV